MHTFTKMTDLKQKQPYREEMELPEKVEAHVSGHEVTVKGPRGELKRSLIYPGVTIKKEGSKLIVVSTTANRREKAVVYTYAAHIKNMLTGVTKGFRYKMKIVFSHFPITVKVAGKEVEITNFYGEKRPRTAEIIGNVKVSATKEEVTLEGNSVEEVGQTMSNLEQATKIRNKDSRIFQDGIYLTSREA